MHTNIITGKQYIGLTSKGIEKRWKSHISFAKKHNKYYFHRAINKYGIDSWKHEILEDNIKNIEDAIFFIGSKIIALIIFIIPYLAMLILDNKKLSKKEIIGNTFGFKGYKKTDRFYIPEELQERILTSKKNSDVSSRNSYDALNYCRIIEILEDSIE